MPWRWLPTVVVLFLWPRALPGQTPKPGPSFEELAAQARAAGDAEQIEQAIDLYGRATALRPDWAEGWWRLGGLFYYRGRFHESRDAYARFESIQPNSGPGLAMLGLCEFALKRYEPALVALERALRLGLAFNPELERSALYQDGVLQSLLGQPDLALQRFTLMLNRLAAANPGVAARDLLGDTELIDALGIAALRIRKLPGDVPPAKSALVRKAGRAQALVGLHDWVSAAAEFRELAASFANERGVHYLYGVFLLKEHPADALAEFEKEIRVSPKEPDARLQIALECLRTGDFERGRKNASEAIALAPDNFAGRLVSARLWLELDKVEPALEEAKAAVKLAPDSPDAHLTLSRCYAQAGRPEEAEREAAEYRRLRPPAQPPGE